MTAADALDVFAELPPRVQTALLSAVQGLRATHRISFSDYPLPVAEYLAASGLVDVAISAGGVTIRRNANTPLVRANLRAFLAEAGVTW